TSASTFHIGQRYKSEATISNGGEVTAQISNLANQLGGSAALTIEGPGSLLHLSTPAANSLGRAVLTIGRSGPAQVDVKGGGKILIEAGASGTSGSGVSIGGSGLALLPGEPANLALGDGTLNVTGAGSEVRITSTLGLFVVGRQGKGSLNIT